jgi:8-oxo-dGTP diphosphatase
MARAASAFLVHNKKLLLHLRDNNHPDVILRNKWGLVGGNVEDGEDFFAGVMREIKEESNLQPSGIKHFENLLVRESGEEVEVGLFYAYLSDEEAKDLKLGNEGLAVTFFDVEEIVNLPLAPSLKEYYLNNKNKIDELIVRDN